MADPGWGIRGKCPPPSHTHSHTHTQHTHTHTHTHSGASHTSVLIKIVTKFMSGQETYENMHHLLQIHLKLKRTTKVKLAVKLSPSTSGTV